MKIIIKFDSYKENKHKVFKLFGIKFKFKDEKKYILEHIFCYFLNKFFKVRKNKIIFANMTNFQFSDNPKYIAEELLKRGKTNLDLVWFISRGTDTTLIPNEFRVVFYDSFRALYELMTAKVWLSNSHLFLPYKKGFKKNKETIYFQTFHGSMGIKKIEADAQNVYSGLGWLKWQKKSASDFDYLFTDSDFEKNIFSSAFWGNGKILMMGKPRDSIFYKDYKPYIKKVKDFYKIPYDNKIILYAPTWRSDKRLNPYNIDIKLLKKTLKLRFGGNWSVLIRSHVHMRKDMFNALYDKNEVINVTKYPDMQELLVAADVLISDYSSCIPEYVILKKPSFIYATDINNYNNGFYYPLSTLPSPVAEDNGELANNILKFDNDLFLKKADEFLIKMGHKDDANSCQRIVDLILEKMKNDR